MTFYSLALLTPWIPYLRRDGVLPTWALTSALLILAVLAVRAALKGRLSLRIRYALWAVVLLRLLLPVQLPWSLPAAPARLTAELPYQLTHPTTYFDPPGLASDAVSTRMRTYTEADPPYGVLTQTLPGGEEVSTTVPYLSRYQVLLLWWWGGVLLTGGVAAACNLRFAWMLRRRRRPCPAQSPLPVYVVEGLSSPCLAGLFRPAVYLPPEVAADETALGHVLAHELTHYAHRDHLWGAARCVCLALHWYDPLVWLAARLSKEDGELACDEGAVRRLGEAQRVPYGKTLVGLVARRSGPAGLLTGSTTMTGGGRAVRRRVELLARPPRAGRAALCAAVSVLAVCLLCAFAGGGAPEAEPDPEELAYRLIARAPDYGEMAPEELRQRLAVPTVPLTQTQGQRVLLLVRYAGLSHADGLDNWAVGVWDQSAGDFLPQVYFLRGDEARSAAWTEGEELFLLCANSTTYQGFETGAAPLWLRFQGGVLTALSALPDAARSSPVGAGLPEDEAFFRGDGLYWHDHKLIPEAGGFTLYARSEDAGAGDPQAQWREVGFVPLAPPGEAQPAPSDFL